MAVRGVASTSIPLHEAVPKTPSRATSLGVVQARRVPLDASLPTLVPDPARRPGVLVRT